MPSSRASRAPCGHVGRLGEHSGSASPGSASPEAPQSEAVSALSSEKKTWARARGSTVSSKRVLIVDDHADNLMLARYIVEEEGHQVIGVLSGDEAVEAAIDCQPDLILLDIVLGDVSGIDIFRQIKQYEQFAQTPIVGITAMTQEAVRQEAIAIGFADYLFKPYRIEDLCQIVKMYCGVSGANDYSGSALNSLGSSSAVEN